MPRHLFLCTKNCKTGIYTLGFSLSKELFCGLNKNQIMENRNTREK
jgi:hypothetical protein